MDELTPKNLASMLVEKHDRFISEYTGEVERWETVSMLREKRDQLKHWLEDDAEDKFAKEFKETERELSELEAKLKVSSKRHYTNTKQAVKEHAEAREYWLKRLKELS
jgi:phosphoglycolate phosphatase-like HAD superfamily hydrolase